MARQARSTLNYRSRAPGRTWRNSELWRALGYLRPYRRTVIASIVMAFLAGGVFVGTVPALFPILQTLLHGDTPQMWIDRMIAERRWGIDLADDAETVRVLSVDGAGAVAYGLTGSAWDRIVENTNQRLREVTLDRPPADVLARLAADSEAGRELLGVDDAAYSAGLVEPVPWHLALARNVIYRLPAHPVGAISVIMLGIFGLAAASGLTRFAQEYLSGKAAYCAVNDVRRDLYDHILRAPMGYFGRTGTADVTSRLVSDANELQAGYMTLLGPAVQQPIFAVLAFLVAMVIDWRLTLLIIMFGPMMAWVMRFLGRKMRRAGVEVLANRAEMLEHVESTLAGIRVVKANVAEEHEAGRLRNILNRLLRFQLKLQKYDAATSPAIETLAVMVVGIIAIVMVYLVRVQGSLTVAGAIIIFGCLAQMADAMRRISKLNVTLQKSNAAAERIFETIDLPMEGDQRSQRRARASDEATERRSDEGVGGKLQQVPKRPELEGTVLSGAPSPAGREWRRSAAQPPGEGARPIGNASAVDPPFAALAPFQREIVFDNVSFRYDPEAPLALDDISLTVQKGESIAIVGRNGSGKTTLLALLPRFFEPESGRVLIDGADLREVSLASLRSQIGVVTQEAVIFPGTIAQNIGYARADASREEIESAARQAEAHEFIMAKAQGYDTPLTGLGSQLSGGQRQRLNIARAILRDPPILILDEATSQVDAESEHLIQQAIHRLMQGRTVFVIAHRFSTILDCDRIALLERGRLEAIGTHEELLETSELYRQLYDRQLVGV